MSRKTDSTGEGKCKAPRSQERGAVSVFIYALKHPVSGEIRYIGKANNAWVRLKQHIADAGRRNTPVYHWIRTLASQGMAPSLEVIAMCSEQDWPQVETEVIAQYRKTHNLLNVADGGVGPYLTCEQRSRSGKDNTRKLHGDPKAKRIWFLKRAIGENLKFFRQNGMAEAHNSVVAKLKTAAKKCPRLFGAYLSLTEM